MDTACKIWHLAILVSYNPQGLVRVDKPLFSSSKIHAGRVVSINWVADDVLLSASAPTIQFNEDDEIRDDVATDVDQLVKGTVVLWRWLSFERYLPQRSVQAFARPSFRGHGMVGEFKFTCSRKR